MKRKISVILAVLLVLSVLAGCGASGGASYDAAKSENAYAPGAPAPAPSEAAYDEEADRPASGNDSIAGSGFVYQTDTDLASKIIYSAYLQIETTAFDDSLAALNAMLGANKAFLESSSTGGASAPAVFRI